MKMKFKYFFSAIVGFASLLLFIAPHTKILDRPLIGLHDMDNGHLLTTVYLWRTEGIVKHHFAPIYSFPPNDINLRSWGLVGKNNRMYHASYPPLSFWLVYLASYLPGVGISEATARLTSLGVFIVALTFLFIYLYTTYNLASAIFATGLFSLVPASAYFFGGVIVADIAVFAFWVPAFVFLSFFLHQQQNKLIFYLFLIWLSLAVLTEWLGLLTAFSILFYLFYSKIKYKSVNTHEAESEKLAIGNKIIIGILLTTVFSLLVTTVIYFSIATPTNLIHFLTNKYSNRGSFVSFFINLAQQNNLKPTLLNGLNVWFDRVVFGYLWPEFTPFFWLIILTSILTIFSLKIFIKFIKCKPSLLNKITRRVNTDNGLIIGWFLIPPLLHTLFLSNFHYLHDYSFLSFLPFLTIIAAKGFFIISELIEQHLNYRWLNLRLFSLTLSSALLLLFFLLAQNAYHFLFVEQTGGWISTIRLFKAVRAKTNPDDLILTNHDYYPDRWFYLRRNGIMWIKRKEDLNAYSAYYPLFPRVFYVSDYRPFYEDVCGDRPEIAVAHGWMCQIK